MDPPWARLTASTTACPVWTVRRAAEAMATSGDHRSAISAPASTAWARPLESSDRSKSVGPCASALAWRARSEEHTSELQSRGHLVCRLLLEIKKNHTLFSARMYLSQLVILP